MNDNHFTRTKAVACEAAPCCVHDSEKRIETSPEDGTLGVAERRNKPGRAARRRRKKLLDIQRAEEHLIIRGSQPAASPGDERQTQSSQQQAQKRPSVLPQDRSHQLWPAVETCRVQNSWNKNGTDESSLVAQLGYLPGNVIRVTCRALNVPELKNLSDEQHPVAVQLYPIVIRDEYAGGRSDGRKFKSRKRGRTDETEGQEGKGVVDTANKSKLLIEPFPTLYWLTSPLLRVQISKLELEGFGVKLEERLGNSVVDMESMKQAHETYAATRADLLTETDGALIRDRQWESAFGPNRGVAGIRNFGAVKCLHAHTAHYLSGGCHNVVGKWVMEAIAELFRVKNDST
jgi:hypothetical protein